MGCAVSQALSEHFSNTNQQAVLYLLAPKSRTVSWLTMESAQCPNLPTAFEVGVQVKAAHSAKAANNVCFSVGYI
jgi:hypothetical protein